MQTVSISLKVQLVSYQIFYPILNMMIKTMQKEIGPTVLATMRYPSELAKGTVCAYNHFMIVKPGLKAVRSIFKKICQVLRLSFRVNLTKEVQLKESKN